MDRRLQSDIAAPLSVTSFKQRSAVTAKCPLVTYNLIVQNGNGDGKYESGKVVKIVAGDPSEGMEFSEWVVVSGDNSLSMIYSQI